jgi:hypothetical protein
VRLTSTAVPQADDLDKVRVVVSAATDAAMMATGDIAAATDFSLRHVEYRLRAAMLLDLLSKQDQGFVLTGRGKSLLATKQASERERRLWLTIVSECPSIQALAPDLFSEVAPTREQLATRIVHATDMSSSTALRRAGGLLSWRRRLQSRQLSLFPDLGF